MVNSLSIVNQRLIKGATYASVIVAVFLVASKCLAWYITNSLSIKASLVDSLLDTFASMINFIALRHALRPADAEHRFGHGKVEALASLGQSIFIALSAIWLMKEVVHRLAEPTEVIYSSVAIGIMIASTLLTCFLVVGQQYVIKKTNSLGISADSLHYQTDILTNIGVLGSFALSSQFHFIFFDTLVGAAISGYIFYTSWKIASQSFDVLIDRELPAKIVSEIRAIAQEHSGVLGIHDLKTRSSGQSMFIQMHLDLDGSLTLEKAHHIAQQVAMEIYEKFPSSEVIIHQDPIGKTSHHRPPKT